MTFTRRLSLAPILLAMSLFAAPPLGAVTPRAHALRDARAVQPSAWAYISSAWAHALAWWEKEGSSSDPFGVAKPNIAPLPGTSSIPGLPPISEKSGSSSDPFGNPRATTSPPPQGTSPFSGLPPLPGN